MPVESPLNKLKNLLENLETKLRQQPKPSAEAEEIRKKIAELHTEIQKHQNRR